MFDLKQIDEIARGLDEHLRKLESFSGLLQEVKVSLALLRESQEKNYIYELNKVKKDLASLSESLQKYGLPKTSEYEKVLNELREILESEDWPFAVEPHLICDNQEKASIRANAILDLFVAENFKFKRFLDFGCGEGHTIPAAKSREASLTIGFDVDKGKYKFDNHDFTDNFDVVRSKAPYDIILLHDVLDHIVIDDPIETLKKAASVLSREGRIYVRNHPWCSRHGGHLYTKSNKAFLHLIMDEIELVRWKGLETEHNIKILKPLETYRYWIQEAGLEIKSELPIRSKVEEFFLKPSVIRERLNKNWDDSELVQNYMEIDFVEYILESPKDKSNKQIF